MIIVVQKQLINSQIKSPQVLLIDHENNNRGLVDTREALELAQSVDLDLVVVSQDKDTPVAKILNYGKLQYQKKKRQSQSARPTVKEVRFRPNVGAADYNLRISQATQWLSKGDSVKFAIRLRGREHQYRDQAGKLLDRIVNDLTSVGKVQSLDKRSLILQVIPA
ncbi:translation initiation factor IF-3 [Fischerella thermalis]|uniref:Translation initiation factor IF-3 n=1 Tax=Fischerella thermalis CCMEE 5318 TaxID=2019666 RepID=A0A2N6L9P2_9CYAN|nr:translation initiation factor IF-3 [Fischerella thermalis]PLZ08004.1 translation initiation factor IF-3 [Fischerella thermalis WC1110]PLZ13895.1 translation initiation factor IF-3 [Fischerella thermalis WC119]PLZ25339.1 translation initiation factor IF-3 [Fischerella thermalis WC559]PLZ32745.1 translation initiation factor IF-3 [Fischerella thermalis WC542]PLZ61686.1 translation initiation factor IF-3 [Fischerella thermalis WC442]PLZ62142.1 translation initiation factor IF-3 [Fischerella t